MFVKCSWKAKCSRNVREMFTTYNFLISRTLLRIYFISENHFSAHKGMRTPLERRTPTCIWENIPNLFRYLRNAHISIEKYTGRSNSRAPKVTIFILFKSKATKYFLKDTDVFRHLSPTCGKVTDSMWNFFTGTVDSICWAHRIIFVSWEKPTCDVAPMSCPWQSNNFHSKSIKVVSLHGPFWFMTNATTENRNFVESSLQRGN